MLDCRGTIRSVATHLKATHREEQVGVRRRVDGSQRVLPLDRSERSGQSVLDVPENGTTKVDIVLDETHTAVTRPALLVVVSEDVGVVRVGLSREISLNEIARLLLREAEEDVNTIDVSRVETDGVTDLGSLVAECQAV